MSLVTLGARIGGLTYIFGGCLLSAFYVPDWVIKTWWFDLMAVSLLALAWAKWPWWKFWE